MLVPAPAARLTDIHTCTMCPPPAGAPIISPGAPNVLIGGMPAARMTDLCVCVPPPPAGGDAIITGAFTVLVNFMPAARMSDLTVKGGVIVSGCPTVMIGMMGFGLPSLPLSLFDLILRELQEFLRDVTEMYEEGKRTRGDAVQDILDFVFQKREGYLFGVDEFKFLNVKLDLDYVWDDKEASLLVDFEFSGIDINVDSGAEYFDSFLVPFGVRLEEDFLTVKVKGQQGVGFVDGTSIPSGLSGRLDAAHAKGATGTVSVYTGDDKNNPESMVSVNGTVLNAEAAWDATAADGGRQTGLAGYGKAGADVVDGAITFEANQKHDDGSVTSERAKVNIAGGAVGASAGAWGVKDESTERVHVGAEGGVEALLGGTVSVDVSHGPAYTSTDRYKF